MMRAIQLCPFSLKLALSLYAIVPYCLMANPHGCDPRSGTATLSHPDPATLTVHTSDKAIIHWDSFSIAQGETTRFEMPSATSAVLNRVVGGNLSEIYGTLESNGRVFLINPKGVIFGEHAQINTASFFASTLDALDADFLKGEDIVFAGDSKASIVNLGTISGWDGDVALIAYQVDNKGVIEAKNGVVTLAAGTNILLSPKGNQRILIHACSLEKETASNGIDNSGAIHALQAELIADGNPYQFAIKDSGQIDALAVEKRGGSVYLVAEGGRIDATGKYLAQQGGEVHLLGKEIYIHGDAEIDTSGANQGGTILIGGDFQGKNPDIPNAETTFVGEKVQINADALETGDGGKVILWGDRATGFFGNISAQGGPISGNGGFVEISAKSNDLYFQGRVNTLAEHGHPGTLLLDPTTITISLSNTDVAFPTPLATCSLPSCSMTNCFSPSTVSNTANLKVSDLAAVLQTGCVLINAGDGGGSVSIGNVLFDTGADLSWTAPTTLGVVAPNTITVNANITPTQGSIILTALGQDTTAFGDGILVNSGVTLSTSTGSIELTGTGTSYDSGQSIDIEKSNGINILGSVSSLSGSITMTGTGGSAGSTNHGIRIAGAGATVSTGSGGAIELTGTGGIPATPFNNYNAGCGVILEDGGQVLNSSASSLTSINITGTATAFGPQASGVALDGSAASTSVANNAGPVTITGVVNAGITGSSDVSQGVWISNSSVSSTSGTITISGTNNSAGVSSMGVLINTAGSISSSMSGTISVTGHVVNAADSSTGVNLPSSVGTISTAGDLTVIGTNTSTVGSNQYGIQVIGPSSQILGDGNNSGMTGTAGGGATGSNNVGILVEAAGQILQVSNLVGTGGSGMDTTQGVLVTGISSLISTTTGTLNITGTGGGSGTNADGVAVLASGQITSTSGDGITIIGTGATDGTTGVIVDGSLGVASITATPGKINITGTAGSGSIYGILVENNAAISTSPTGGIVLTSPNANVGVLSNSSVSTENCMITIMSEGLIIEGGNNGGASVETTVSGNINITSGAQINITGGSYASSVAQINAVGDISITSNGDCRLLGGSGAVSDAIITATGRIDATLNSNDYFLNGSGGDSSTAHFSAGNGITLGGSNFFLQPGSSLVPGGSNAFIESTGAGTSIVLRAGNNITLLGGVSTSNQSSYIQTTDATLSNPVTIYCHSLTLLGGYLANNSAAILTQHGPIKIFSLGNVNLTGGLANAANAEIRAIQQGWIILGAHNLFVQGGAPFTRTSIETALGNIGIVCTEDCIFTTLNDPDSVAIALVQNGTSPQSGDLVLTAVGSINLSGYSTLSSPANGGMLLVAGLDVEIGNHSVVTAGALSHSTLTLVVDERHPFPPGIGPGQFILDTGGTLETSPNNISVPIRIFTARREQNTVDAPINGVTFVPGPEFVDSATERWGVYFPSLFYGNQGFTFFYKNTGIAPPSGNAGLLSANTIARTLYRAAFVDSELFYELSDMDWYTYADSFRFSTFGIGFKERENGEYNSGDYHKLLTSYEVVNDRGVSLRRKRWLSRLDMIH